MNEKEALEIVLGNPFKCPICKSKGCVPMANNPDSPIAIIGEFPGKEEIIKGRPMVGRMGEVLSKELGKLGIDLQRCRIGNLWHHAKNGNEECLQYGAQQVVTNCIGKEVILLLGSDTVTYFTGKKVSNVSSLVVPSDYFSGIVFASVNPAQVFHQGLGELRLALQKFARYVNVRNLL